MKTADSFFATRVPRLLFRPALLAMVACALLALAASASAEIIGVEQFDYPDGPIANQTGGTFWDFGNIAAPVHDGTPSLWSNTVGAPVVSGGRLVTDNNSALRPHNGPSLGFGVGSDEEKGSVTDGRLQQVVYHRVSFTTGATVPTFLGLSTYDFGTERIFFGKRSNQSVFGIETFNGFGVQNSTVAVAANTTYLLVSKVDYVNNRLSLFINPTLGGTEPTTPDAVINNYTTNNFSTSVRLGSATGGAVAWDNLVVATSWAELGGTVVTTATDEDNPLLGGSGTGTSLREAVKYSPAGTLITFAPALSGQTCTLSLGEMVIDKALIIDASALANGITIDANRTARPFFIAGSTASLTLKSLALVNGNGVGTTSNVGGAIFLSTANLFLQRCTLSGNFAGSGGAIWEEGSSTCRLEECTLTSNRATGSGDAGGIAILAGTCTLSSCTVSGNTGTGGGGGLYLQSPASVSLSNCLIAGNTDSAANDIDKFSGTLTPSGSNLIGSNATVESTFPIGPLAGTQATPLNPKLSPLANFGGPTLTMHPLIGSPAIDAGGTTDPGGTDQRGFPRFVDGDGSGTAQLDIGAVEAGRLFAVGTPGDNGGDSLRFYLGFLASQPPGTRLGFDHNNFPANSVTLSGTELSVSASLTGLFIDASNLSGPVTISGNNASRVFNIAAGATVAMHSLVIQNGKSPDGVNGGGGSNGGGILNAGSLSLFSSAVLNNRTGNGDNGPFAGGNGGGGGGIFSNGALSLTNCTLSGNTTGNGGNGGDVNSGFGGFGGTGGSGGGISSSGPLNLTACTLSGNVTGNGGNGGNGSSPDGNSGGDGGGGGGIRKNDDIPYRLTACTVVGNRTGSGGTGRGGNGFFGFGGGVSSGSLILQNSVVANNSAFGTAKDVNVLSLTYVGANLLGTNASSNGAASGPAPIIADPLLAPLGDYGGPTQTIPPLPGSPAIDHASGSTATSDQRGFAIVGTPDLGAAEYQGTADLRRYWTQDWDGDGIPYGIEQALGTDPLLSDRANPRNLTVPTFNAQGQPSVTFGRSAAAAPGTLWILKRSTDLITFTEIFRFDGSTTSTGSGISSTVGPSSILVRDQNPPFPKAFYRFEAVSP